MMRENEKNDFKPTKEEIRTINHYWQEAMKKAKGARNREQRRKSHARG